MVICDHDRIGYGLGNDIAHPILDRKNHPRKRILSASNPDSNDVSNGERVDELKPEFFILVPAIARYSHGQFNLHRTSRYVGRGDVAVTWHAVFRRFCPLLELIGIEHNDPLLFILLK